MGVGFGFRSGCPGFAALGEDFGAHVAALFGPFVVLLSQDGADQLRPTKPGQLGQHGLGLHGQVCCDAGTLRDEGCCWFTGVVARPNPTLH